MIKKSISNLRNIFTRSLLNSSKFNNSANKTSPPEVEIAQIRNMNLKFETSEWNVNLYPFYPQVYRKKGKNVYEVATNSIVLAMSFINKNVDDEVAWSNRKTISLRFKDVTNLLEAEVGSGKQVIIETQNITKNSGGNNNSERHRQLILRDVPQYSVVDNTRSSSISKLKAREQQWSFQTAMPYSEYRVMYKLIENSLLDLSGWKFMMEVQRKASFKKMEHRTHQDKEIDQLFQGG